MARDRNLGVFYTVTEFAGGGDLTSLFMPPPASTMPALGDTPHAPPSKEYAERFASVALALLEGVKYMHANGFAHRDIKPQNGTRGDTCLHHGILSNPFLITSTLLRLIVPHCRRSVLLTADGRVKICDMGIAWSVGHRAKRLRRRLATFDGDYEGEGGGSGAEEEDGTMTGVGTLPYMPPEAFGEAFGSDSGAGCSGGSGDGSLALADYDPRAWDVYSLGVVLWQLWVREALPFDGLSPHALVRKVGDSWPFVRL
jgi:serine/threonine protein kinase